MEYLAGESRTGANGLREPPVVEFNSEVDAKTNVPPSKQEGKRLTRTVEIHDGNVVNNNSFQMQNALVYPPIAKWKPKRWRADARGVNLQVCRLAIRR